MNGYIHPPDEPFNDVMEHSFMGLSALNVRLRCEWWAADPSLRRHPANVNNVFLNHHLRGFSLKALIRRPSVVAAWYERYHHRFIEMPCAANVGLVSG